VSNFIKTVLIVGLGSIGRRHVGIIKKLFPEIHIVVLRHKKCEKNDIDIFSLHECVTSIDEAIAKNPQAAIIANPATMHIEVAEKLASNDIHILIEKPISDSSKGVQKLIDTCHKNNIILMTAYNLRFLPSLIEFKSQIQKNKIGNIYSIRSEIGQYLPNWRPESDYRSSVSANKSLGGGVLLELSHEIDYLRWIFGPVNWVKSHVSKQSDLDIDVEDSANIILGFKNGDGGELIASLNMDFIRHDTTRRCFLIGEKGTLLWDGVAGKVKYFSKGDDNWSTVFTSKPDRNYTYAEEIKSFFLSIESNEFPYISGDDGMHVLSIIEAIKKSSSIDSTVYL
jgi:predicted dehydrogenase